MTPADAYGIAVVGEAMMFAVGTRSLSTPSGIINPLRLAKCLFAIPRPCNDLPGEANVPVRFQKPRLPREKRKSVLLVAQAEMKTGE
jgi:hypothetical protein